MKTIWQYPLDITDVQTIGMPEGAEIISAQMQGSQLCLWAIVIATRAVTPRIICIFGTGDEMFTAAEYSPIDTVQMAGGSLVWHVFERV